MDSATRSSKPSSNISDIVYRFAKVCRLRSVGVFSNENPNPNHHHHQNNICKKNGSNKASSDGTEDTECSDQKIHPQPTQIETHEDVAAIAVLKLFDTISALKLAYIELQEGHIPYSPEKIQAADDRIVSELKTLSEIKRSFKNISKPKSSSSLSGPILVEELQNHQFQLEKLQCQIQIKDSDILKLQQEVQELDRKNQELDSMIKQKALDEKRSQPKTFSHAFKAATKSIHDFAKPLISLMKASAWDLDLAVNSIEDSINYSKRSHKKYAFEAYLSRRMFHGFSIKYLSLDDILRFKDPFDALIEYPDSEFAKFCRSKYLLVVHSRMETAFFGNLDQRSFVLSGGHPRTPLYQAFVKMAKCVWVLQAMAASNDSKAEIFGVQRGSEFSELYMEDVVEDKDDTPKPNSKSRLRVGLMIMPGFKIGQTVFRSRVYLTS
ncbi:protein of unknown function DUF641 [Macleaya cordata]|uniref:Uncharacterized protein n=1 Tax=Macleaya cordata TaxID=56857 RepID=A0A200RAD6_MACCD|nr:protein of unknown function DUF641 [Macleaya cordata]